MALHTHFRDDVLRGLGAPQKSIPARYFYDLAGSRLFDEITCLPEYYPTRLERALLRRHQSDIARAAAGRDILVEFGAGSARKTPLVLTALAPGTYIPVDVAGAYLQQAAAEIAAVQPGLLVLPLQADFTRPFELPIAAPGQRLLGFFPGSTIGNLAPAQAVDLLRHFATLLGTEAQLLIGIDLRKDPQLLKAAYDDASGVTAAFNLNLVARINRELDGTLPIDALVHEARWNARLGRVELHLVAQRDIDFTVAHQPFRLRAGESIHSENSYKYRREEVALLARASHWEPLAYWTDAQQHFSLNLWHHPQPSLEP